MPGAHRSLDSKPVMGYGADHGQQPITSRSSGRRCCRGGKRGAVPASRAPFEPTLARWDQAEIDAMDRAWRATTGKNSPHGLEQ
jgi:hypothetical protein